MFTQTGGTWTQTAKLVAGDPAAHAILGYSLAFSGDTALLGAPFHDKTDAGAAAAYVFTRSGDMSAPGGQVWTQQVKLAASDKITEDCFGAAVALAGRTVLVGVPVENNGAGTVYAYTLGERPASAAT